MALLAGIHYPEGYIIVKKTMIPRVFFVPKRALNFCVFSSDADFETALCFVIITQQTIEVSRVVGQVCDLLSKTARSAIITPADGG